MKSSGAGAEARVYLCALRGAKAPLFHRRTKQFTTEARIHRENPFLFLRGSVTPWLSRTDYFTVTSVRVMAGYWWFHWAEMLSNVRRKGAVWPGASGATFRSTGSR